MSESKSAPEDNNDIELKLFGRTDVGQVREHNEDNFLVADLTEGSRTLLEADRQRVLGQRGNIFGVCDGMGGAAAGEVASQMAVDLIYDKLAAQDIPGSPNDFARGIVTAVEEAGQEIYEEARTDRSRRGMGTTSTIAGMMSDRLFLAQVGDSRAYILRDQQFVQVTRDQSLVNQLIEAGQLTEEEAETFEHNNIILQALGTSETVQVDLTYVDIRANDLLLVCSDGLSGMLRDSELREVLLRTKEPMEVCRELTDMANAAGGHDNITVIVVLFSGQGLQAASSDDAELKYRKFTLPPQDAMSATTRGGPSPLADVRTPPPSEEAANETRDLRVSHTMLGTLSPEAEAPELPSAHAPSYVPPSDEEAGGLTPALVGAIVIFSLLLLVIVGFIFLR